ncbi:TPA: hypothetical protein ACH3X1_006524 [Trebouxia sp. C0004]
MQQNEQRRQRCPRSQDSQGAGWSGCEASQPVRASHIQALTLVASAGQLQKTGKRCRSSAQPSSSEAPAASSAADPSAEPPTGKPADTLADLVARIRALEQNQADSQQLRSDLLQTQTELAATRSELLKAQTELIAACSDLAEFKGSVDKRLGGHASLLA